jgi:hypothetical protein
MTLVPAGSVRETVSSLVVSGPLLVTSKTTWALVQSSPRPYMFTLAASPADDDAAVDEGCAEGALKVAGLGDLCGSRLGEDEDDADVCGDTAGVRAGDPEAAGSGTGPADAGGVSWPFNVRAIATAAIATTTAAPAASQRPGSDASRMRSRSPDQKARPPAVLAAYAPAALVSASRSLYRYAAVALPRNSGATLTRSARLISASSAYTARHSSHWLR